MLLNMMLNMRRRRKRMSEWFPMVKNKKITVKIYRCNKCNCLKCKQIRAFPGRMSLRCECRFCEYRREKEQKRPEERRSIAEHKPWRKTRKPVRLSSDDLLKTAKEYKRDKMLENLFKKQRIRIRKRKRNHLNHLKRLTPNELHRETEFWEKYHAKKACRILYKKCCSFLRYIETLSLKTHPRNIVRSRFDLLMTRLLKVGKHIDILKKIKVPKEKLQTIRDLIDDQRVITTNKK